MARLPAAAPDTDRRWVLRVPPIRTCALTSLDPALVGARRGPRRADQGDGGRAGHRRARLPSSAQLCQAPTVTDLAHARALRAGRGQVEPAVEIRPLARYDALIA